MTTYIITGATSMIGIALIEYISSFNENVIYAVCQENSKGLKKITFSTEYKSSFFRNLKTHFKYCLEENINKLRKRGHYMNII